MREYEIYFVDCNGYGGTITTKCKDRYVAKKHLIQYARAWGLEPIRDVEIKEEGVRIW